MKPQTFAGLGPQGGEARGTRVRPPDVTRCLESWGEARPGHWRGREEGQQGSSVGRHGAGFEGGSLCLVLLLWNGGGRGRRQGPPEQTLAEAERLPAGGEGSQGHTTVWAGVESSETEVMSCHSGSMLHPSRTFLG